MNTIDATLAERGRRYGAFPGHARITQRIKEAMRNHTNWDRLDDDQKEALEMIAHKIGRILNGDPNYIDSWHDIVGYAKLVEDRLIAAQALNAVSDDPIHRTAASFNYESPKNIAAGLRKLGLMLIEDAATDIFRAADELEVLADATALGTQAARSDKPSGNAERKA